MNVFGIESILAGEKRRLNKGGFLRVGIDRLEIIVTAEEDLAFFLQLCQSFQARGLLRFVHHWPHLYFRVPGIAHFHGAQTCSDSIAKGFELLTGNQDAPDSCALLAGFEGHLADHLFCEEVEQLGAGCAIRP